MLIKALGLLIDAMTWDEILTAIGTVLLGLRTLGNPTKRSYKVMGLS